VKEVGFSDDPNLEILVLVADALGDLRSSLVLVGGCATGLMLTAPRAQLIRATNDVDVVAKVATTAQYHELETAVASHGFAHDMSPEAPICRWVRDGVKLDLMPSEPGILGFHNRWYPLAVETAEWVTIPGGMTIRLITAPAFVATKLEAFGGRGANDYLASHDLEDILTVVDGRPELVEEVRRESIDLRRFFAQQFTALIADPDFMQAMPGHLPPDAASQARLPELIRRLKQIAESDGE
jgi:predicted nucleotidyltransferase